MKRYGTRIRTTPNEETTKEWLHEGYYYEYLHPTFAEAEESLYGEVGDLASQFETSFEATQKYPENQGGGFFFRFGDGTEGRALVTTAELG